MQNQFRLDNLLARDVVPQWFEGIAIVQSVWRQLQAEGRESDFPSPENILIAPGGFVTAAGGSDGKPVQAAAHVLGLMLGNDVPVRLRLAVSQGTTDDGFASLAEFSEALAYFERPNPQGIIEAFRQRALLARPLETASSVRVDAAPAVEKQPALTPPPSRRRVSRLARAVATFFVLAGTLAWTMRDRLPDLRALKMSAAESPAPETPTARPNTKRTTASTSTLQHNNVDAVPTARRVSTSESAARSTVSALPALQVVATTLSYHYPTILPSEPVIEIEPKDELGDVTLADVRNARFDTSDRIYSQADPEVTLPLSVYPRFPNDSRAASVAAGTKLELTIAATGLVERVRMLSTPRNIHEFMLLSAAKAWRFEPATIDGRPVRFRQLMTLTALP